MSSVAGKGRKQPICTEIRDWAEFQNIVAGAKYQNWAFRGQADATWPLQSSLSRYLKDYKIHPQAWPIQEDRILRIFRRKAHLFLEKVPEVTDDFQWLALMQHHGAPTRLLDFTWSPFVAAFFALERATKDAVVWAVFLPSIYNRNSQFGKQELPGWQLGLRNPGTYSKYYLNNRVPFVSVGEPNIMNKRLTAQSGTFLVPGVLDPPVEQILAGYPNPEQTIVKFILKTENLRGGAMRALYSMNITNATLFPDLDGLAKSMGFEVEFHYAYDPKAFYPNAGYESDFKNLFHMPTRAEN